MFSLSMKEKERDVVHNAAIIVDNINIISGYDTIISTSLTYFYGSINWELSVEIMS